MKDEIKEILDRLERIDHKEYIAFEFADSATFDEVARCFEERKKMADYIINLQEENERLKEDIEDISVSHFSLFKSYEDYKSRCEEVITDLENTKKYNVKLEFGDILIFIDVDHVNYLIKILQGKNK